MTRARHISLAAMFRHQLRTGAVPGHSCQKRDPAEQRHEHADEQDRHPCLNARSRCAMVTVGVQVERHVQRAEPDERRRNHHDRQNHCDHSHDGPDTDHNAAITNTGAARRPRTIRSVCPMFCDISDLLDRWVACASLSCNHDRSRAIPVSAMCVRRARRHRPFDRDHT